MLKMLAFCQVSNGEKKQIKIKKNEKYIGKITCLIYFYICIIKADIIQIDLIVFFFFFGYIVICFKFCRVKPLKMHV